MRTGLLLLLFFLFLLPLKGQEIQYGLAFKSYEVEKEKRTGLNLTPKKPFHFPKGFIMSFDVNLDSKMIHPFGHICRILNEDGSLIDLVLNGFNDAGQTMISLISASYGIYFDQPFDNVNIHYDRFIPIEIQVDTKNSAIRFLVGNSEFTKQNVNLSRLKNVNILFGKNNMSRIQTTDVPLFKLKDIKIAGMSKELLFHWELSKHSDTGVYDNLKSCFASCENPVWLSDSHVSWKKQAAFKTRSNPQLACNPDKNEIGIFDQDKFIRFNLRSSTFTEEEVLHPLIFSYSNSNNLIYNSVTKKYNCYIFNRDQEREILVYDTLENQWNKELEIRRYPGNWHHSNLFLEKDNCLYLFGGYEYHQYKNGFDRYNYSNQMWESLLLKGDRIAPRYLCGLGEIDSRHILLFGGYGSETGNQRVSPHCYYDLYKIDVKSLEVKKIWEMEPPLVDFVVAGSIIPDAEQKSFYALAYPISQVHTNLSLMKISIDKPEYQTIADTIPFTFEDAKTSVDLYMDKTLNLLIATIINTQNDNSCTVSIYTLANPPFSRSKLYQKEEKTNFLPLILGISGFFILTCIGLFVKKRKKRKPVKKILFGNTVKNKQSIYLFGEFQLIDKEGNDITKDFSPMLKQLFLLIVLYTMKDSKGVSNFKMKSLLWYDKSEESAKNNRGVFINKLRHTLNRIGDIKIKSQNMFWSIEFDNDVFCDYSEALFLMDKLSKNKKNPDMEDIQSLLSIVSRGEFLPDLPIEWIDSFKSEFSNNLIDFLLELYNQLESVISPALAVFLADAIFVHDSLSEEALQIKCRNLLKIGKNESSKKVFNAFCNEYKLLLGEPYKGSFKNLLKNGANNVGLL
ncbi:MAG: hypothetical protein LBP83_06675 [Dysgonamonadaceae bacterium]|jgi:two-component SAPR family response regulator|nr:hypothetical protein [Dysgonamonadaceae bacterium]